MNDNRSRGYHIPTNVFDGPSLLGIAARNWIEAAVIGIIPGWLFWQFVHFEELSLNNRQKRRSIP